MSLALKNTFYPSAGKASGRDLILEVGDNLLVLDQGYGPKSITKVVGNWEKGKINIAGLFQWAPIDDNEILGISDIQGPGEEQFLGAFVRFKLDDPSNFRVLRTISTSDPERTFYRLGYPYVAVLGRDGYFLSMENKVTLYKSDSAGNLKPLSAFPAGPDLSPVIPAKFRTRADFAPFMGAVEGTAMPAGLYAWENFLYILSRSPLGAGQTHWVLTKIDPIDGEALGRAVVPSQANHLTVIPGPQNWAFIEKGPVKAWGLQAIQKAWFIPSDRFRGRLKGDICSK